MKYKLLLLILVFFITLNIYAKPTYGLWWNSTWSAKKALYVNETAAEARYQEVIDVWLNTTGANAIANCTNEVRFVNATETTELKSIILNDLAPNCQVRIYQINATASTNSQLVGYFYYKNAAATYPNYGTKVYYDAFSNSALDTTKWTLYEQNAGQHKITVTGGNLSMKFNVSSAGHGMLLYSNGLNNFTAQTMSLSFYLANGAGGGNYLITPQIRVSRSPPADTYGYAYMNNPMASPVRYIQKRNPGNYTNIQTTTIAQPMTTWIRGMIQANGETIRIWTNMSNEATVNDGEIGLSTGLQAIHMYSNTVNDEWWFDNFCVINSGTDFCNIYSTALLYNLGSEQTNGGSGNPPQWVEGSNTTSPVSPSTYLQSIINFNINWTDSDNNIDNITFQLGRPTGTIINYTSTTVPNVQNNSINSYNVKTNGLLVSNGEGQVDDGAVYGKRAALFTANENFVLTRAEIKIENVVGSNTMNLSIRTNSSGIPTTILSNCTFVIGGGSHSYQGCNLNATLTQGITYWLVSWFTTATGGNQISYWGNWTYNANLAKQTSVSETSWVEDRLWEYKIYKNQTNNNTWFINFTQNQLGNAGTYNYTWFAVDATGLQNKTQTIGYTINQGTRTVSLTLDGQAADVIRTFNGTSVLYPVVASESNSADTDCSYTLYENAVSTGQTGSSITYNVNRGNNTFVFTYNSSACTNWSAITQSRTLKINKGILNGSISAPPVTYPTFLSATSTESNTGDTDITYQTGCGGLFASGLSGSFNLPAGNHNCILNTTSGTFANWTANESIATITGTINQATPNVKAYIDNTVANRTGTYPFSVTINGNSTTTDVSTFNLYVNSSTASGNPATITNTFDVGTHQVVYNTSGNTNYSAASNSSLFVIVQAASASTITIYNLTNTSYWNANGMNFVFKAIDSNSANMTMKAYLDGTQEYSNTTYYNNTNATFTKNIAAAKQYNFTIWTNNTGGTTATQTIFFTINDYQTSYITYQQIANETASINASIAFQYNPDLISNITSNLTYGAYSKGIETYTTKNTSYIENKKTFYVPLAATNNSNSTFYFGNNIYWANASVTAFNSASNQQINYWTVWLAADTNDDTFTEAESYGFKTDITSLLGLANIGVKVQLNNTNYTAAMTNSTLYTATIIMPSEITGTNETFIVTKFLNLEHDGSTANRTGTKTIYVYASSLAKCTPSDAAVALSIMGYDERTLALQNFSINLAINIYSSGAFVKTRTFNWTDDSNNRTICIVPATATYVITAEIEYHNEPTYERRNYWLVNATINNVTTLVNLYLLNISYAENVVYTVKDSSNVIVSDVIVKAQRYYISDNNYKNVAMGKTGGTGMTNIKLERYNALYRFVLEKNGVVLATISKEQITSLTNTLFLSPPALTEYFQYYNQIAHSCSVNTSSYLICTLSDTSNKVVSARLTVKKFTTTAWTDVCDNSAAASAMTLTCYLGNTSANYFYYALSVYTNPVSAWTVIASEYITTMIQALEYGNMGWVITIILVLGCVLLGASVSPLVALIMLNVGLIASYMMSWYILPLPAYLTGIVAVIVIFMVKTRA